MTGINLRQGSLTIAATALMELMKQTPGWDGPAKTEFDRQINEILGRLEEAAIRIDFVHYAEALAETALKEAAVVAVVL
ncbi:MAG: hypothetical protein RLZZ603_636 [Actinomycetota bacterium]|jgi:hypothetical protein